MINELKLNVNENCNASMQYKNTMESNIKEKNKKTAHSLINVNLLDMFHINKCNMFIGCRSNFRYKKIF